jgi:DNA-binding IclR family transcriptional regulator
VEASRARIGYQARNSTADKTLEILGMFDDEHLVISGVEVARAIGTARSTAYRYLQSLVSAGFLEERRGDGFRIGPRVIELARIARRSWGLSDAALPTMRALRDELGETVLLTRRFGDRVICLERVETRSALRISYERGSMLPIHAGAAALVLLAWLPTQDVRRVLNGAELERFTDDTVVHVDAIVERLEQIRGDGYVISHGELDSGITGVAAPVRDQAGQVIAAVSIAAPSHRVPHARERGVIDAVCRSAEVVAAGCR